MKLVAPGYEILTEISDGGVKELQQIEKIARVCYKSEDRISADGESAKKMIAGLIKSDHLAMLEHSTLSVLFTVDRGISHELCRHRMASFAQESTRYCDYSSGKFGGDCQFIDITDSFLSDPKMSMVKLAKIENVLTEWESALQDAEKHYKNMIAFGATPQIARSVLPNSTKTNITVTANYREWRHIFALRAVGTTGAPHPQMQEIMIPLLRDVAKRIPIVFDDLVEQVKDHKSSDKS